ncbi:MAG: metallophosphoesterase [Verrucomicrobiales bacterium]|nr:metallophosphoesterase [Verrucomicrobiales bacterium]
MPLELGTLNRRRFFAGIAGAGASWLGQQALSAAEAIEAPGGSWALLSDTHIPADLGERHRGSCMAENAGRIVTEILSRDSGTAGVIVSGDCARLFGRADDYRNFAGLIEPLVHGRREVHLLMGNHDNREVFADTCATAFPDRGGPTGRRTAFLPSEHLNWFLLDSLEEGTPVAGRLGREQLDWLAAALDRHPDKPAVVMAHHHLKIRPERGTIYKPMSALRDSAELHEVMKSHPQVKAYFYGHTHRWEIGRTREGIHLVNLPSSAYVFEASQPGGWVEATAREDGLDLVLHSLNPLHRAHGERHRLRWR